MLTEYSKTLTVIVPAYNSAKTIAACVESLLSQTYPQDLTEIVIVDNNSTDDTATIVKQYPVTLAHESVQTAYAARNRGIAIAQGEILVFTDADCVANEDWLANLVLPFENSAVGVVGGAVISQPAAGSLVEAFLAQVKVVSAATFRNSEPRGFPTTNVAYRRAALDRVGIFDAAMPGGGDVDLAWRVQAYGGYQSVYVSEAIVSHKHRAHWHGVFKQYQRYGFTEIALSTLYRGEPFHRRTPAYQIRDMLKQVRAIFIYILSFCIRLFRFKRWRNDRLYLFGPLLWLLLDAGSLLGKCKGLVRTRFFRRNPYVTNIAEVIRYPLNTFGTEHG